MMAKQALEAAIDRAGGQVAFSKAIGVRQSLVWYWLKRSKRGIPAEHLLKIEAVTGIPRHELRPDLYPPERAAS